MEEGKPGFPDPAGKWGGRWRRAKALRIDNIEGLDEILDAILCRKNCAPLCRAETGAINRSFDIPISPRCNRQNIYGPSSIFIVLWTLQYHSSALANRSLIP